MNDVIDILCPGTPIEDFKPHSELVKHYIRTRGNKLCIYVEQKMSELECPVCKNTDERKFVKDYTAGDLICTDCGGIVCERMYVSNADDSYQSVNPYFSEQNNFKSSLIHCGRKMRKLNSTVEKDLNKFNCENLCTSEMFKDNQRKYVYDLLESIRLLTDLNSEKIEEVKVMYNLYRNIMSRIHKLHLTLATMFYIVLEEQNNAI